MSTENPTTPRFRRANSYSQPSSSVESPRVSGSSGSTVAPRPPFSQSRTHSTPHLSRFGEATGVGSSGALESTAAARRDDPFERNQPASRPGRSRKEVAPATSSSQLRQETSFFDPDPPLPHEDFVFFGGSPKQDRNSGGRKGSEPSTRSQRSRSLSKTSSVRFEDHPPNLGRVGDFDRKSDAVPVKASPSKITAQELSSRDNSWINAEVSSFYVGYSPKSGVTPITLHMSRALFANPFQVADRQCSDTRRSKQMWQCVT
jgi:hypothetical protein